MVSVKSYTYDPIKSKSVFRIPPKEDYISSQYCSVTVRLNFEYRRCLSLNGLVYFVTFTYNDNGVLCIDGQNYLYNPHIRQLCNKSIFRRYLLSHGYEFKFAFFGENGDGKGIRGVDNNPHYHALIYLYPTSSCDSYYHDEKHFLELCHNSWNQDPDSMSCQLKLLNRGNVTYSKKGALVQDCKVFGYCSLYCVKQLSDGSYNYIVKNKFERITFITLLDLVIPAPYEFSIYLYPYDRLSSLLKEFVFRYCDKLEVLKPFLKKYDDVLLSLRDAIQYSLSELFGITDFSNDFSFLYHQDLFLSSFYAKVSVLPLFTAFYKFMVTVHSARYRLSTNLGICGLQHVTPGFLLDVSSLECFDVPRINLPSYYYRRLFYSRVKHDGKSLYVLNSTFNDYVKIFYSLNRFNSLVSTFRINRCSFSSILSDSFKASLSVIPDRVFVAYKFYRGLCFDSCDYFDIDPLDCLSYLRDLDYSVHNFHLIPKGLDDYIHDGYFSFNLHPFFNYPDIDRLSYLYDSFLDKQSSSNRVRIVNEFDKLNQFINNNNYECFKCF